MTLSEETAPNALPRRVVVIGNSGSGKTTFARGLAESLGHTHLELDSVYHQANWQALPLDRFRGAVETFVCREPSWVVDGNYSAVRDILWSAADTVVWLDIPRVHDLASVVRRTAVRLVRREELWNGNRERWDNWLYLHDMHRSIIAWTWANHPVYRRQYLEAMADLRWSHLKVLRARSRREARSWLEAWRREYARVSG